MASARRIKVFVDSSVLIAGSISARGSARDLLIAGISGHIVVIISNLVLSETERNLSRKAPSALPAFNNCRELLPKVISDPTRAQLTAASEVVHLKDTPILAAAVLAEADYLATYDRQHLLAYRDEIAARFALAVVTPDQVVGVQDQPLL